MRRTLAPFIAVIGALAVLGTSACSSQTAAANDPNAPLTIATMPISDDPTAVNPIEALAALLKKETGRDVKIVDVPDYLAVVEAIRSDHVDFGIMSGFPSALAVSTGEVDAIMAWKGSDDPVSTCVVLNDSPVQKLEDLKGGKVAFADQASSSGYFMPVYMLHEAGLERDRDYDYVFAGGHEGSFAALSQGQADAACTAVMLTKLGAPMFPFADGEWRGVGESPSMPIMGSVLARTSLDDDTRTLLQEKLPIIFGEENKEALGALGASFAGKEMIVDPAPSDYQSFVDIAEVAGVTLAGLK
ncbi:MAG: phosphate/phosphite/phosphonate ABC transporter substrate-binding protein [Rhodococcus sp.]|nr:phosphate/phosphite/phosphonate ABC transporter substrate-binding protein [Rhodococcus sp. (in: high G+C Gram-positive bacteria)]